MCPGQPCNVKGEEGVCNVLLVPHTHTHLLTDNRGPDSGSNWSNATVTGTASVSGG